MKNFSYTLEVSSVHDKHTIVCRNWLPWQKECGSVTEGCAFVYKFTSLMCSLSSFVYKDGLPWHTEIPQRFEMGSNYRLEGNSCQLNHSNYRLKGNCYQLDHSNCRLEGNSCQLSHSNCWLKGQTCRGANKIKPFNDPFIKWLTKGLFKEIGLLLLEGEFLPFSNRDSNRDLLPFINGNVRGQLLKDITIGDACSPFSLSTVCSHIENSSLLCSRAPLRSGSL